MRQLSLSLFRGRHFDRVIIILCIRWYITYKLSYRDLVEMMAERGVDISHTTILRWVQRYVPEFEKCWHRYARPVGTSWRVDETYSQLGAGGAPGRMSESRHKASTGTVNLTSRTDRTDERS